MPNGCTNAFGTHCGGVSVWSVASGGRMGQVMGEDAVEVSPGATDCVQDCQAQNRIRGRAVVLGFPFPVPAESRLTPASRNPQHICGNDGGSSDCSAPRSSTTARGLAGGGAYSALDR